MFARGFKERDKPIGGLLREAVFDPMRIGPRQAVEDDVRIAFAGLGHEREFVTARLRIGQFRGW